jgi:hypothetical protein
MLPLAPYDVDASSWEILEYVAVETLHRRRVLFRSCVIKACCIDVIYLSILLFLVCENRRSLMSIRFH